jgi:hypothetical protein
VSAVSFLRLSSAPPPLRETLEVEDDGSWRAWRSNATAVGRFAGDERGGRRVLDAARAARASGPPPPASAGGVLDEATDELDIDNTAVEVAYGDTPAGPWGDALAAARDLIADAANHPLAAVALRIMEPGRLRLEHRGSETLEVELGSGRFEAIVYDAAGLPTDSTFGPVDLGQITAGPGWSAELQVEPIAPPPGGKVEVEVSFVADDDGVYVPVSVSGSWTAPPVD